MVPGFPTLTIIYVSCNLLVMCCSIPDVKVHFLSLFLYDVENAGKPGKKRSCMGVSGYHNQYALECNFWFNLAWCIILCWRNLASAHYIIMCDAHIAMLM